MPAALAHRIGAGAFTLRKGPPTSGPAVNDPEGSDKNVETTGFDPRAIEGIYRQLHMAARNAYRRNPQQTMNVTALVNEAWLKLQAGDCAFENELHYLKTAALAMRHILVDYARYRGAEQRDRHEEVTLLESAMPDLNLGRSQDWVALDLALNKLQRLDPRAADVIALRFFVGLSIEKTAELLEVSPRSAVRDWQRARAFLIQQMAE